MITKKSIAHSIFTSSSWWMTCYCCSIIRQWLSFFAYFMILLLTLQGIFALYQWYTFPDVLTIRGGRVVSAVAGGMIHIQWDVKKNSGCYGEVTRSILGQCGYLQLFHGQEVLPEGFDNVLNINMPLPPQVETGQCTYQTEVRYHCVPLDIILPRIQRLPNLPFRVTIRADP